MKNLGRKAKDKVTGFTGIIVGRAEYLYGCAQYGVASEVKSGKPSETNWFDVGRIQILNGGVKPESVKTEKPGAEYNRDAPK